MADIHTMSVQNVTTTILAKTNDVVDAEVWPWGDIALCVGEVTLVMRDDQACKAAAMIQLRRTERDQMLREQAAEAEPAKDQAPADATNETRIPECQQ